MLALPGRASADVREAPAIPGALNSVSCPAANACWAVGQWVSPANTQAVLASWNGATWARVTLPIPRGARSAGLFSVSCVSTTFCWAVGDYDTSSKILPYVLKWNGTAWSLSALPRLVNTIHLAPFSVSCSSAADCWTVQVFGGPLLERWNGSAWRMVPAALERIRVEDHIHRNSWHASCRSQRGLVHRFQVPGRGCPVRPPEPQRVQRVWDGAHWHTLTTPTPSTGLNELRGVSCVTALDCWAVGGILGVNSGSLIEHWNGSAWSIVS